MSAAAPGPHTGHDLDFERWLEIFDTTLDTGWSGPLTETARRRAHGIAWAMAKRLTGSAPRQPT